MPEINDLEISNGSIVEKLYRLHRVIEQESTRLALDSRKLTPSRSVMSPVR